MNVKIIGKKKTDENIIIIGVLFISYCDALWHLNFPKAIEHSSKTKGEKSAPGERHTSQDALRTEGFFLFGEMLKWILCF